MTSRSEPKNREGTQRAGSGFSPPKRPSRAVATLALALGMLALALTFVVLLQRPHEAGDARSTARGSASAAPNAAPNATSSAGPARVVGSTRVVRGSVVRYDGQPIAGARVQARRAGVDDEDEEDDAPEEAPLASARTSIDGTFEVEAPRSALVFEAKAEGFVPAETELDAGAAQPVQLVMKRAAVLRGRVVMEGTGAPVAGAEVVADDDSFVMAEPVWTDADGTFQFDEVEPGIYKPVARARGLFGLASREIVVRAGVEGELATITMQPATALSGQIVVKETRAPCPGGTVTLLGFLSAGITRTAGAGGEVYFDALLPGNYDVEVECPGHPSSHTSDAPLVLTGAELDMEFEVSDAFSETYEPVLRALLVDESGAPIDGSQANLQVAAAAARDPQNFNSSSDVGEDGAVELTLHEFGDYEVVVDGPFGRYGETFEATVVPGGTLDPVRWVLRGGALVEGRVLDVENRPVKRAWVSLAGTPENVVGTDEEGRFVAMNFSRGPVDVDVSLSFGQPLQITSGGVLSPPFDHVYDIVVSAPVGRISGHVEGADLELDAPQVFYQCSSTSKDSRTSDLVNVELDGHFTITRLPSDAVCSLDVSGALGASAHRDGVRPGAEVTFALIAGATLRGHLADAPAVFEVSWQAEQGGFSSGETFVGTHGEWVRAGVHPGPGDLYIRAPDGRTWTARVTVMSGESREVTVQLEGATEGSDADDEE
ncbi:MAG: carboxypeptidase-like regulatory domain-containing protein [Polyangiaceae bacterium]